MQLKEFSPFSEVIESSLQVWLAQSWDWKTFPAFGSMLIVHTPQRSIMGIVYQVQTGSMDPVRHPFPFKKTHEELLAEQPQIFEFLKTTFSCLSLGYKEKDTIFYMLPPEPPTIHSFVTAMKTQELKQFFSSEHYLHLLFNYSNPSYNIDELLLACIKIQHSLKLFSPERLHAFFQTYLLLTGNDYRRLKIFSSRIQNILSIM